MDSNDKRNIDLDISLQNVYNPEYNVSNFNNSNTILYKKIIDDKDQFEKFFESEKIKEIFYLALPTTFFFGCLFLQQTINLTFIGNLINDKKEKEDALNAVGFSHIYVNCLILSIIVGLVSGFDILGSNAFGSKNYKLLGYYLQRGQIICYIVLTSLLLIHYFFALKIISLFNIKDDVMFLIEKYIYYLFLYSLADIQFSINFRYINVIDKSYVNLIILFITLLFHPLWCYLFMMVWKEIGIIQGAGIALIVSQTINSLLGLIYIYLIKPLPESIFAFSKKSFIGWKSYLKISIPSAFLTCVEWWAFEIISFIALTISEEAFTIHIFALNISINCYTIALGFGISTTIIIGREFGNGSLESAKKYFKLIFFFAMLIDFVIFLGLIFMKGFLFEKLVGDQELAYDAHNVLWVMVFTIFFDLIQTMFSSFFRGIGKQKVASGISFLNFYGIQIGLALLLTKILNYGIIGIWIAVFSGLFILSIIYTIYFLRLDLSKILQETQNRLEEDKKLIEDQF